MEQRLESLAKLLRDAANEAEECCRLQRETPGLYSSVIEIKVKNGVLHSQLNEMRQKEVKYKAAIEQEKERSNVLRQRLENLSGQNALLVKTEQSNLKAENSDVSDTLRPTKVAELYLDMCDEQWMDAFEILDRSACSEDMAIQTILDIFEDIVRFCRMKSKQQELKLQQNLLLSEQTTFTVRINELNAIQDDVNWPQSVQMYLQCCKKEVSSMTFGNLLEMYLMESGAKSKWDVQRFQPFVKECIKICWLCVIQNPPMHFMFEKNIKGKPFNTDVYKPYSKSGKYLDFLVLPALYLHENGPLLAKGVAQGAKILTPVKLRRFSNKPSTRNERGPGRQDEERQTANIFSEYLWTYPENESETGRRSRSTERKNYFERNRSENLTRSKSASR